MIGLPTETEEDILGIPNLISVIGDQYYSIPKEKGKAFYGNDNTSCFVPKPHTPFQWNRRTAAESFEGKQRLLQQAINQRYAKYNWHNADISYLEGSLQEDRRLSSVLIAAVKKGCKFDSWHDFFSMEKWKSAFDECNINPDFYTLRRRAYDEILPWDHISTGVSKKFLISENEKAKKEQTTPNCRKNAAVRISAFKGVFAVNKLRLVFEKGEAARYIGILTLCAPLSGRCAGKCAGKIYRRL
jgi:hypothetical protein